MSEVNLSGLVKRYEAIEVIHGIDLHIEDGEFCVFVGPSGCGKSTLLRMVAGLEQISKGRISIGTRDVTGLDPAERGVAMVFQTYALYPHMSVAQNMGFGLKMNGVAKDEIARKVNEAAQILKLEPYLDRKPKALSGGQRQRVAIGRAIVRGPEVFLFDEPLSNLDAELRVKMRVEIARLHREIGATMIYVTHDQVEAMTLADKIVVLREGRIEQVGTPLELYCDPDNKFVAGFIGSPAMNFLKGEVVAGGIHVPALGDMVTTDIAPRPSGGTSVIVGLRPQDLLLHKTQDLLPHKAEGTHVVDLNEQLGSISYSYLSCPNGEKLVVETKGIAAPLPGSCVSVEVPEGAAMFFDEKTGQRLRS